MREGEAISPSRAMKRGVARERVKLGERERERERAEEKEMRDFHFNFNF